jgi:hypothetical protein
MALYDYDPDLFENLHLPEGADKDEIVNAVVLDTMDMDVLYTDPDFLKRAIDIWSTKKMEEWQLLYDALQMDYDPIHAYSDNVDIKKETDLTDTKNWADDHTETRDLHGTTDMEGKTSAFDSATYQPQSKQEGSGSDTGTVRNAGTDTGTLRKAGYVREFGRRFGNIGNLTPTQILKEYIEYHDSVCFADIVVNDFINRFIRLVY